MYIEKRPTCVTVIGWAWIIIGGLMAFSGSMAFFMSTTMGDAITNDPNTPTMFRIFPFLTFIQVCIAVVGIISGISFLKLKSWARSVLEILTWVLLIFMMVFGIYTLIDMTKISMDHGPLGFGAMGVVMIIFIFAFYGVPLGIMLKYLRGEKVKNAMEEPA